MIIIGWLLSWLVDYYLLSSSAFALLIIREFSLFFPNLFWAEIHAKWYYLYVLICKLAYLFVCVLVLYSYHSFMVYLVCYYFWMVTMVRVCLQPWVSGGFVHEFVLWTTRIYLRTVHHDHGTSGYWFIGFPNSRWFIGFLNSRLWSLLARIICLLISLLSIIIFDIYLYVY